MGIRTAIGRVLHIDYFFGLCGELFLLFSQYRGVKQWMWRTKFEIFSRILMKYAEFPIIDGKMFATFM